MKRLSLKWIAVLALTPLTELTSTRIYAGCCDQVSELAEDNQAALILEARVTGLTSLKLDSGRIVTDVTLQPIETFKGVEQNIPLTLRMPGGTIGNKTVLDSRLIELDIGKDYIFRLIRHHNSWRCLNARAEAATIKSDNRRNTYRKQRIQQGHTSQRIQLAPSPVSLDDGTATYSPSSNSLRFSPNFTSRITPTGYIEFGGIPGRFAYCDNGAAISYIVDTEELPSGITQSQALQACQEAFAEWSNASGLKFRYTGNQTFGQAADSLNNNDYILRIQLHDKYNSISSNSTLGVASPIYRSNGSYPNGGLGGKVKNQEFNLLVGGYCILNHRSNTMSNYQSFVQVLTHEIGHVLGLKHSSEDPNESAPILADAAMYYKVHNDSRGADIRTYDEDRIDFAYPSDNLPPVAFDRIMYAVTTPSNSNFPTGLEVNTLTIVGNDIETPNSLDVQFSSETSNAGLFSTNTSNKINYLANAYYNSQLTAQQISNLSFYDKINYRISDGTNLSPYYTLRIVGFYADSDPSDGLPDAWMITNFGNSTAGAVGSDQHPDSDPDGDGISNRIEFMYGSNPNDFNSGNPMLHYDHSDETVNWNTNNLMPYYLEYSEDLANWTTMLSIVGSGNLTTVGVPNPGKTKRFFRVRLQP